MRDIPGFEGKYAISKEGKVWSYPREWYCGKPLMKMSNKGGFVLSRKLSNKGYVTVTLCSDSICKNKTIHRILAETFIPNPSNLPQVNHKNGIKTDNRIENLEWCSAKENMQHAFRNGLIRTGNKKKSPNKTIFVG